MMIFFCWLFTTIIIIVIFALLMPFRQCCCRISGGEGRCEMHAMETRAPCRGVAGARG